MRRKRHLNRQKKQWLCLLMVIVMVMTMFSPALGQKENAAYAMNSAANNFNKSTKLINDSAANMISIALKQADKTGEQLGYDDE